MLSRAATSIRRCIALYLAVTLLLIGPLAHLQQAMAESPGVKKLVVGGVAAAGLALALTSVTKHTASAAASAGGGLLARIGGFFSKALASIGFKSASGAAVKSAGLFGGSFWVIPAVIGVGLVAWYLYKKYYSPDEYYRDNYNRYDRSSGDRYDNPAYRAQLYGAGGDYSAFQYGNQNYNPYGNQYGYGASPYGYGYGYRPTSITDQLKMMVSGGAYVPPSAMAANYSLSGSLGGVPMIGNPAFQLRSPYPLNGFGTAAISGPTGISGSLFDVPGIGDPARVGPVDRVGRGLTGQEATLIQNRSSFQGALAPQSTVPSTLKEATDVRNAAYGRMVDALKAVREGSTTVDVKRAIEDYQAAEARMKELSGNR